MPSSFRPLNLNRVFDFATLQFASVVEIDTTDGFFVLLDNSIPLSPEYPTRWRTRGEVGNTPNDQHSFIWSPDTTITRV